MQDDNRGGCHDLGYGAVVFSGDCPESVTCLYGIGHC